MRPPCNRSTSDMTRTNGLLTKTNRRPPRPVMRAPPRSLEPQRGRPPSWHSLPSRRLRDGARPAAARRRSRSGRADDYAPDRRRVEPRLTGQGPAAGGRLGAPRPRLHSVHPLGPLGLGASNKPYILSILSYMHVIYENIHKRVFCFVSPAVPRYPAGQYSGRRTAEVVDIYS